MVSDYPDFTRLMQIIGADIMVPIDLQAAYVMMPVDIQAQYITLAIDITAQSVGNIDVNLAAQDVGDITVDINAQSIGDITISIDAQNIGVKLEPDWQAVQGADKNLTGNASCGNGSWTTLIDYTVTTGKTMYVCQFGFALYEVGAMAIRLFYETGGSPTYLAYDGGQQGGGKSLKKPMAVSAGDHVKLQAFQKTGASELCYGSVGGYEI